MFPGSIENKWSGIRVFTNQRFALPRPLGCTQMFCNIGVGNELPSEPEIQGMPGANCSIFGCSRSRGNTEIGIFKVLKVIDAEAKNIRDKWIAIIKRSRQEDPAFKSQKERDTLHICELHFAPEGIEHSEYTAN